MIGGALVPEALAVTILVNNPPWLIMGIDNNRGLTVYRSLALRDTDEKYRPVLAALAEADYLSILRRELVFDEGMMFGRAELTNYQLNERRKHVRTP